MLWLNFAKAGMSTSHSLPSFLWNIFQNSFGLYLSMSGTFFENAYLPLMHAYLYNLRASFVAWLPLPYYLLRCMYFYLHVRHSSVNHGAICFPHLFGLFGLIYFISFTTPAFTASVSKKCSTCYDLSALLHSVLSTKDSNYERNSAFSVCSFQVWALAA